MGVLEGALPHHGHAFAIVLVLEGGLRNLVHDGAVRAPGLIGVGRLADLDLNGAEVHGDVEPEVRQL
jgi:hypothetical protein